MHPKKKIKALSNIIVSNKKDMKNIWYLDITASVYMTYNLSFYITSNLDHQTADNKTADCIVLKT